MPDGYTRGGTITPEWWIGQVQRGRAFRKTFAHEDRWEDWRRWYRGEWRKGILPSNVYFKVLRTLIPRVYYRNPSVSITPKKPGLEEMLLAKLLERMDNSLLDAMGVKEQMKCAVQYATMFGTSGMRLGYGAEFTPTPDPFTTEDPDAGGRRMQRRVEYNDLVHPNAPWALAAHPGNIIVPATTRNIHEARWICYETTRPIEDVVDDPRFENTKELQEGMRGGGAGSRGQMLAQANPNQDRMRSGVVLWEIRDKKSGQVFVMAPFSNAAPPNKKILFRSDDDLQIGRRFNFYPLVFNTDDDVFWGVPDSMIIEPQQVEKNEIRTQAMYHRRIALKKILYEQGSISPDELSKFLAGDDVGIGVAVKNIGGIKDFPDVAIPPALLEMEQLVDHEVQEILGLGVNQFGEYAPGSADRSATEASVVNMAAQIRVDERRDACADLLTYLVSDMNHILAERWDAEMVSRIAGPDGAELWVKWNPSQLGSALDYEVKVDPDTSLPLTKQLREQKAAQLFGIARGDPYIEQWNLRKFVLNETYGVDANWLLKPRDQVEQEGQQQMQQMVQLAQTVPEAAKILFGHGGGGRGGGKLSAVGGR